jgi:hypothetical protein
VIAVKPEPSALSARERRRAAALAATERVIAAAGGQLETLVERLLSLAITARRAKRPREEQAAARMLALAETRPAELREAC